LLILRGDETHTRSLVKTISWRALGTLDTFAISWFLTGRLAMASSIAGAEIFTKLAWYYCHERVWAAISWGRHRPPHPHPGAGQLDPGGASATVGEPAAAAPPSHDRGQDTRHGAGQDTGQDTGQNPTANPR
jgi:uncharacterized membrane protein